MTVVEWHPDELIDRREALSANEREKLDVHLARCSACRFELRARDDFAALLDDDGEEDEELARLVGRAVTAPRPGRSRRLVVGLCIAAALVAGSAAAWVAQKPPPAPRLDPLELGKRLPAAPSRSEPVIEPAGEPAPEAVPPTETPTEASKTTESAAALFARANEARRAGRRDEALALYRALAARFPGTPEAEVAEATLGRMLLDGGDPEKALSAYDKYLEKGGALGEEALVGRAVALQRLGRRDQERAAWQELLARHPQSIHAGRARARLAELAK
jgi:tetratricopeptide repeat protein